MFVTKWSKTSIVMELDIIIGYAKLVVVDDVGRGYRALGNHGRTRRNVS